MSSCGMCQPLKKRGWRNEPDAQKRACAWWGYLLASLAIKLLRALPAQVADIIITGRSNGSRVWFEPIGLHVQVGRTIRWTNHGPGNSHTATAYHPAVSARLQRILGGAVPWDPDYLLQEESFSVALCGGFVRRRCLQLLLYSP